jgi:hypothetical protein
MPRITAIDNERVKHVNFVMDELYSLNADLYESLIDRKDSDTKTTIKTMITKLKTINDSFEEDL